MDSIPLSLYVHFPWCVRKCPYCDFNSHPVKGEFPEDAYIAALIRDLDFELSLATGHRPLASIFFGGGTPSLFSGKAVATLLEAVQKRLAFAPDIEITIEANPGTADEANFRGYRAAGVNRLSLGVQSFDDAKLKALGRIHGADDARRAFALARTAGFDNINLDLMYALPGQAPEQAAADLQAAIALAPEHLSYYHLTLEPNTEFHARPPPLPDEDAAWDMQLAGQALLAQAGYAQYEVSAYARPGRQCRHNLNYWRFGDYLGIGAGAHGKLTSMIPSADGRGWRVAPGEGVTRRARRKQPRSYLEAAGTREALHEERIVAASELPFEYALNALRLNEGFALPDFAGRTGLPESALDAPLRKAQGRGFVEREGAIVRPSAAGRTWLNQLTGLFLPSPGRPGVPHSEGL